MKFRGLIIAGFALTALAATLFWSNRRESAGNTDSTADAAPKILSLNADDITKVEIRRGAGDVIVLQRNSPTLWQMTAPKPLGVDSDSMSTFLHTLSSINAERLVEEQGADLGTFGLAEPAFAIAITTKDGKSQDLLVGDESPMGNTVYASLKGDPRVFTMASHTKTSLDMTPSNLREKRLLTVDFTKVSRVQVVTPRMDIELEAKEGQWQLSKPTGVRADASYLDEIVRNLREARIDGDATDEDARKYASAFASGTPIATAKAMQDSETQELQLRKSGETYYAKSSTAEGVFKVSNAIGEGLDKGLDDIRNKKLFDFGSTNPDRVEIQSGEKSIVLTRNGDDWVTDGKKLDNSGVQTVVDQLRNLSATRFARSGFSKSSIDLTTSSNSGKQIERILIAREGNRYIAKREDGPVLYELDLKPVEDILKSADEVKPAEAPPQ